MFVVGIIFLVLAVIALVAAVTATSNDSRAAGRGAAGLFLVLALGSILIACLSTVPTRNVGIVTQFNKPTGRTTGAGLHWTAPWQDIDDWDASGQTYAHLDKNCVWVTIAAQRRACIPVQIEWAAKADRAPENWATYKEVDGIDDGRFGTFVARRVNPQINAALTSTFASFDPLGTVNPASGDAPAPDLNKLYHGPLLAALNTALGQDLQIRSIAFGAPGYDEPTTEAIAAYGKKVLEARNLAVDKSNAEVRKKISETNASINNVTRCLEIAEKLGKEPGWCLGGAPNLTKSVS